MFHLSPKHKYPVAAGGDGPYVIDRDGKRYLDARGGAGFSSLGHSDREVVETITAKLDQRKRCFALGRTKFLDKLARSIDQVTGAT
jgi:4-aminobutyrate aminotransferase-like enzyme